MALARRSEQSFTEMLSWHPRDVWTLVDLYEQEAAQLAEENRESRFASATQQLQQRMRQGLTGG
jgi:hypothetical protein